MKIEKLHSGITAVHVEGVRASSYSTDYIHLVDSDGVDILIARNVIAHIIFATAERYKMLGTLDVIRLLNKVESQ